MGNKNNLNDKSLEKIVGGVYEPDISRKDYYENIILGSNKHENEIDIYIDGHDHIGIYDEKYPSPKIEGQK